ncbi:MAG: DNA-methyltransferase [Planctomycetota bacterium]
MYCRSRDPLKRNSAEEEDTFDVEGQLDQIGEPKSRPGELIELGPHKLLCGDSIRRQNVERLLAGEHIDMILTDPPYGVDYVAIKNGATVTNDNRRYLRKLLRAIRRVQSPIKYVFGHWKTYAEYVDVMGLPGTLIVWNKSHASNGSMRGHNFHLYNPRHEFLLYYGPQKHKAGLYEENVWNIPNEVIDDHPTVKPVKLCLRAVQNSSNVGDTVLDLFGGSGSTLISPGSRICEPNATGVFARP